MKKRKCTLKYNLVVFYLTDTIEVFTYLRYLSAEFLTEFSQEHNTLPQQKL